MCLVSAKNVDKNVDESRAGRTKKDGKGKRNEKRRRET